MKNITKYSTDHKRFSKNVDKQLKFVNPYIKPVPIISITDQSITMPVLEGINAFDWLYTANLDDINKFSSKIMGYLTGTIKTSIISDFNQNKWLSKLSEIECNVSNKYIQEILYELRGYKFKNLFYYGINHGDFNLNNLLINEKLEIYASNFWSSFLESPLNDIVKIRQDTHHLVSLKIKELEHAENISILKKIDKKISDLISSDSILEEYYLPFQILNLIKLLPYNEQISDYLIKEIEKLTLDLHRKNAVL